MEILEKIDRMSELKSEMKSLKNDFQTELFEYVINEFRKKGFITDPRGEQYKRGLYCPKTKINVHVGNITNNSVSISIRDMVDDGMTWGIAYSKLFSGSNVSFIYVKETFEQFFEKTYEKHVKKLNKILAD